MLRMDQLETGYGKKQVLFGLSLEAQAGETVGIIGPNGSGKSTTLKAVCGLIQPWEGEIRFEGAVLNGATPAQNVQRGITLAPQGNRVFSDLSVMENLEIGATRCLGRSCKAGSTPCWRCSRSSASGRRRWQENCPAANSRCWPWPEP